MIPAERSHLHVAAKTHAGMSGKNNEDRYAVSAFRLDDEKSTPVVLAVVADGIGGHRAGEVAAEIAVEIISQTVAESNGSDPVNTLRRAIVQASQQIQVLSEKDLEKKGMGATCACVWVIGGRLYAAYVGDSRIYLMRGGKIQQISIDHTWVQDAIQAGILTPEQAQSHPNAHVIRRYLGSRQTVEPDTRLRLSQDESDEQSEANQGLQIQPGDQILACSDGLTDLVSAEEILATVQQTTDQSEALSTLVNLANKRGGHDNITIVLLRSPDSGVPAPALSGETVRVAASATETVRVPAPAAETLRAPAVPAPKDRKLALSLTCLGIGVILLVFAALIGGAYYFMQGKADKTPTATQMITTPGEQPGLSPSPATPELYATDTPLGPAVVTPGSPAVTQPVTQPGAAQPTMTYTPWPTDTPSP